MAAADSSDHDLRRCPACGSTEYHRTKRTSLERIQFRPAMARCDKCGIRFPHLGHHREYPDPLKLAAAAEAVAGYGEEKKAPKVAGGNTQARVTEQVAAADSSARAARACPACGSAEYHRTKRTTMERMLRRPPMARCESCGLRFPYPGRREEHRGALKLGGAAATLPRSAEETRAPGMGEGSSGAKVAQEVAVVDHSNDGLRCCPTCRSTKYHRTKRTKVERILRRPSMARCESCGMRFPYPGRRRECPEPLKSAVVEATGPGSEEEKKAPTMAEESSKPKLAQQVTGVDNPNPGSAADSSNQGLSRCPACGSTSYRRSRRTTLEHLLLRPKMARCRRCRERFPYPKK